MKKTVSFLIALLTIGIAMAQTEPTIVSTDVQKRNVLIEEFTGVNCGYCPDGHFRCNEIAAQYPGHAWSINIHQGGYAAMYTTQWGNGLASQYNVSGWPSGVTNRCPNIQGRDQWQSSAASVRAEDSPVNIAATATIDPMTRKLEVYVEMYYTADQTVSSNFLNVVLLQNNVIGPQSNYGNYNSEYITPDGKYRHMHMLRDMLTGQWGEEITTISTGTLVQRTYTYDIPSIIGEVAINDFADLQILAFVTETHKNVHTACNAEITLLPGGFISGFDYENEGCSLDYLPYVSVSNTFDEPITSWTFEYDGAEVTYSKTVNPGATDTIQLPLTTITYDNSPVTNCTTTKSITLKSIAKGDEVLPVAGSANTITFADFDIYTVQGPFHLRLGGDAYRTECGVQFIDHSNCEAVWTKDGFAETDINFGNVQYISQLPDASIVEIDFQNNEPGLYILRLTDGYGDGWSWTNDTKVSGMWLDDANGSVISVNWGYSHAVEFTQLDYYLNITTAGDGSQNVGIDDINASIDFSVYPNPVRDQLNINADQPVRMIEIIDMNGRTVLTNVASQTISTKALATGIYVVRVTTESGIGMQRFVKE